MSGQKDSEDPNGEPDEFETAVAVCGFGFFNCFLLLACLPGLMATVFEVSTMSYVFPAAECDLNLSLMEKGALNAITFAGTIISAVPWGFVADTFSRKYVLVVGLFVEGTITLLSSLSKTSLQLLIWKFFGGLTACGPTAGFVSYISEFHGKDHRTIIIIVIGFINGLPLIILPIIAQSIVPRNTSLELGNLKLKSWQILVAITGLPALLSSFLILLFPESPKFLMSKGRNDQAIKIFQKMYSMNKCSKLHNYPIFKLSGIPKKTKRRLSFTEQRKEIAKKFLEGSKQFRLLCTKNYIGLTLKACIMQLPLSMSVFSLSLWQPQVFAIYQEMIRLGFKVTNTCSEITYILNKTALVQTDIINNNCQVYMDKISYEDNFFVSGSVLFNFILATFLVRYIGNNSLLRTYMVIASVSLLLKYCSGTHGLTTFLACTCSACGAVSITLVINTMVNLYPTSIRTMTVIFLLSCGRLGALLGNLFLPLLMSINCTAMFIVYSLNYIWSFMISFFLPNTTEEALK